MLSAILALLHTPNLHLRYDLLLQEPAPKSLITHDAWIALSPSVCDYAQDPTCPRALIYANRLLDPTSFNQILVPNTRNIVALDLVAADSAICIINVYNQSDLNCAFPHIRSLFPLPDQLDLVLLTGDFKLHHQLWDPARDEPPKENAVEAVDFFLDNGLVHLLPPGTQTFRSLSNPSYSSAIDLVLGNTVTSDRLIE
jgi:hypothetical protein